jgi:16S rRNA (guanine1516-N2)-methyltransferase
MSVTIAVSPLSPSVEALAMTLAQQLNLPLALKQQERYDYLLVLAADYIKLQKTTGTSLPLYVDFLSGKMNYRSQHISLKSEALVRAMGLKNKTNPTIVDATGGWASDSFTLVSLGFEITVLERSPIIYTLIANGIERAQKDFDVAVKMNRMRLVQADAITWLQQLKIEERPDIIYLDPMFPERKKSALSKQKMRVLHDIVGEDADAETLLKVALTCATKRVVVKRPRLAETLVAASPAPSFSLSGSSSRFDVYLRL